MSTNQAPQNDEAQNVARIEWVDAPDGWKLVPIRPTKEMRAAAGREASKYNASRQTFFAGDAWAPMVDNAPTYVVGEWDGQGLPPVGTTCEVDVAGVWISGVALAHCLPPKEGFAVAQIDDGVGIAIGVEHDFRPIRTPEQIAADERERNVRNACNAISKALAELHESEEPTAVTIIEAMIDAGYLKP